MISLILVYAFATPGAAVLPHLGAYSPSHEGLVSGGIQALRLAVLLASLAVLLAAIPRDRILAGLYFLLRPLARMGVDVDRVAARIWLTLHYAEQTKPGRSGEWRSCLRSAFEGNDDARQTIQLEVGRLFWLDYQILLCSVLALAFLVLRGGA
jgi:energy-coupling factor transport system permease protein